MAPPTDVYIAAVERGRALFNELAVVRADQPVDRSIEESYWIEEDQLRRGKPAILGRTLAKFGIAFDAVEYVSAIPKVDGKDDSAIYTNWIDGRNGVAIVNLMDKTRDKNAEEDKFFPSEIFWQSWSRVATRHSSPLSSLRAVAQYFVTNSMSQTVAADVLAHSHVTRDEDEHLEYTELDDGFYAVLGTVNGASTMRTLMDHRQALRFKTVEKVVLVKPEDKTQVLCPTFIMILTSPRDVDQLSLP